ncbi:hypothetical protein BC941DRAFT_490566 [Chlamydoabsidia padenii]|nr:hypothetical protein BC941DRAFT_490566 [Chlamydoabsidia padenii]
MNLSFLTDYVKNKRIQILTTFVDSNLENIIAASYGHQSKSQDLLFAWQNKDPYLLRKKIVYKEQIWVEVKNAITALAQTRLKYTTEGLKALTDTATSSRRLLILINALAEDTTNPLAEHTTNPLVTDTTDPLGADTAQRADDTIDNNDGFPSPTADHCEFQLHKLAYKKMIDSQSLTKKGIHFLQNLNYDGESIKGVLQQFVASTLLSDHVSSIEKEAVMLHLLGIVNLIHPVVLARSFENQT